ncbi:hypothetical protein BDY19DRAFT_970404 [Irpex rosettiformis]|uniref:Uncharacterized protein n=1 Tax=Irpex rosettiformis TaxID=378272 RepID=A0ACB8TRI0_9APHY|nr:hypothetical protein BDY19DRAFT_970404 [Irpex rosettiformis]
MDVDSEGEVEMLFNSGAFYGQDSLEVDPEANPPVPRRTPVPPPPSRSANNTASRTVLCPSTVQRRAPPVVLAEGSTNPPRPAVPTAPHRVIDLDAYHDGPFRGALARAVEASRQTEQRRQQQQSQAAHAGEGVMRRINFNHIRPSPTNKPNLSRDQVATT